MQILITGRNQKITEPMREYVTTKVEKLSRFDHRITKAEMILKVDGLRHIAELILHASAGKEVVAKEESDDMYASVDVLLGKIEKQLKKNRDKLKERRKEKSAVRGAAAVEAADTSREETYEDIIRKADFKSAKKGK